MRTDLRAAMKDRRGNDARVIRALIAAIDNAEAPPLQADLKATDQHRFSDGSAEVERLSLSGAQVHSVLVREMQERELAATEMDRLDRPDRAETLRGEARLVGRYIE
jgi:uncharacterized protein YqeY